MCEVRTHKGKKVKGLPASCLRGNLGHGCNFDNTSFKIFDIGITVGKTNRSDERLNPVDYFFLGLNFAKTTVELDDDMLLQILFRVREYYYGLTITMEKEGSKVEDWIGKIVQFKFCEESLHRLSLVEAQGDLVPSTKATDRIVNVLGSDSGEKLHTLLV